MLYIPRLTEFKWLFIGAVDERTYPMTKVKRISSALLEQP